MTPNDIIVGQKYVHKNHPDLVYLGAGNIKDYEKQEFTNKHLVIIEDEESEEGFQVGYVVENPQPDDWWWPLFEKLD